MCHNVTNAPRHDFSRKVAKGQSDSKTVRDTAQPQGVSTHQIWDPYLK